MTTDQTYFFPPLLDTLANKNKKFAMSKICTIITRGLYIFYPIFTAVYIESG